MRESLFPPADADDRSSHAIRQLIGGLGMALPPLVWLVAAWRPMAELPRWHLLTSVSAYYYTGAVAVFVGVLIALAVFLLTYQGYNNPYQLRDRVTAAIAGCMAVVVAFLPTVPPKPVSPPEWWTPLMGKLHIGAATVLFLAFIFFAFFLFPKSSSPRTRLPKGKQRRNILYRLSGGVMLACIVWAGIASLRKSPIFWPETLMLEFFAVSWLVKGRADWTVRAAWRVMRGQRTDAP